MISKENLDSLGDSYAGKQTRELFICLQRAQEQGDIGLSLWLAAILGALLSGDSVKIGVLDMAIRTAITAADLADTHGMDKEAD